MTAVKSSLSEFPDALPIGTVLGDFTVTKVIGLGGFGIVYMAHDRALERTVAIKEYLPITIAGRTNAQTVLVRSTHQLDTYTSGLHSFMREARLQARFSHPAMLEVYQVWEQNGTAYMAMRYYPGSSLRDLRHDAQGSQLFDEASIERIMSPVFDALEELHSQSILHRDVSPDNILIMPSGAPVLLDFGSARMVVAGAEQSLTTVLKPGYAPIEQYADDGAMEQGPWTDVYGLGAVLHFLAVGNAPPQAVTRLLGGSLREFDEQAPFRYSPAFVAAVNGALVVKPHDRLKSVAALRDALGWGKPVPAERPMQTVITAPGPAPVAASPLPNTQSRPPQPQLTHSAAAEPKPGGRRAAVIGGILLALALLLGGMGYTKFMRPSAAPAGKEMPAATTLPSPQPTATPPAAAVPSVALPPASERAPAATPQARMQAPAVTASVPDGNPVTSTAAAPLAGNKRPDAKPDKGSVPRTPASGTVKPSRPDEPRQTSAVCERLFAKLSLGNAVLTETEQKQLPACR